jgi:hypothetical protein
LVVGGQRLGWSDLGRIVVEARRQLKEKTERAGRPSAQWLMNFSYVPSPSSRRFLMPPTS